MTSTDRGALAGLRVLITDGEQRAALAIVRSLGAAAAVPFVCSSSGRSLAGASRFAGADIVAADPLEQPAEFVRDIRAIVGRLGIECVIPVTEAALRPVLRSAHLFENVLLPFPSSDTFAAASDKHRVMTLAYDLGIPVPRQVVLARPDSEHGEVSSLRFPVVLKPAVSVAEHEKPRKLTVRHVETAGRLQDAIDDLPAAAFPLLVQERVIGPGVGIFLLRWDGRIVARAAHRRLREKPPSGGVSVYRESIMPPADAAKHAESLLEALDWQGVAMVEFKVEQDSGVPYLMEINGRFWGSLQLAIDAGVDFPRLLLEAARGELPHDVVEGRPGVRLRWLLGDLDHLLLRVRKSAGELSLERGAPGRLNTLGSFLLPWRPGERWEVLRPSDPRPFAREIGEWISSVASRD